MATALAEQQQQQQQLIAFTKMHGCGNDYVVIDCCHERHPYLLAAAEADDDTAAADWWRDMIRFLCDRRFGVGSDGLMLVAPARSCAVGADVRMIMYNIDGSRARMCGNGIRCVALYHCRNHHQHEHEHEHHDATAGADCCCSMLIDTDSGVRAAQVRPSSSSGARVTIDMGAPSEIANSQSCGAVGGRTFSFTAVTVGNPHCVVFLRDGAELGEQLAWQTLREFDVRSFGPMLEHADFLTERSNIEFAAVIERGRVAVRTWERGSGETLACGTGACAVAFAYSLSSAAMHESVTIELLGGQLEMRFIEQHREHEHEATQQRRIHMTGEAQIVFSGSAPFPTTRLLLRVSEPENLRVVHGVLASDTKLMALLHGDHPPVGGEIGVCVCLTRYQETPNDETDELMIELAALRRFTVLEAHLNSQGEWYARIAWFDDTDEPRIRTADLLPQAYREMLGQVAPMLKSHLNSLSDARRYQLERTFGLMDYSYTPPPTGADHDQEPPLPSDRSTTSCNDTPTTSTTTTAPTLHTQATLHVDSPWISCESLSRVAVFSFWASAIYCSGQLQHRKLHRALLESSSIAARLELLLRALQSRLANASGSSFASLTDSSSSLRMSMTSSTEFASISAPNTLTHSLRQACCEAICHRIIELTTNASSNLDDATAAASRQQLLDAFTTTCSIEIVQQIVDHFLHRLRPLTREHFEALCALNPSRTYRLNLTKARIDASWASLFAHFHRLESVNLSYCVKLTSAALSAILQSGGFNNLTHLDLSVCKSLQGTVVGFENLTNLRVLSLTSTFVDTNTLLSLHTLTNLHTLYLSGVPTLTPAVATKWAESLTKLTALRASECHVSDEVLITLCTALTKLRELNLKANSRITDEAAAPALRHLTHLQLLDLSVNASLGDFTLEAIQHATQLRSLNLSNTEISDAGTGYIAAFLRLTTLDLSRSSITNATIRSLAPLRSLTSLNLQYSLISDAALALLAPLVSLRSLNISGCMRITDDGIQSFVDSCPRMLRQLTFFSLGSPAITNTSLQWLLQFTALDSLRLWGTTILQSDVDHFVDSSHLKVDEGMASSKGTYILVRKSQSDSAFQTLLARSTGSS